MKKSLIALAALAVVSAASAQSTLTFGGYIDRAYTTVNNTNDAKDQKAVSSAAGTTTVIISGSEDLGGGLKVGFWINTDWSEAAGQTQDKTVVTTVPTSAGAASAAALPLTTTSVATVSAGTSGFANSQSYLELVSAQAGSLRLGSPNNEILTAVTSVASPAFSTGIGSAYSSSFSIHNGMGTGTTGNGNVVGLVKVAADGAGARGIRQSNTIKYISPNFSGFSVAYGMNQKNANTGASDLDTVGITDLSLNYVNGPATVMFAQAKYKAGNFAVAPVNGDLQANTSSTMSILGASYQVLPALKLHAGIGKSTSSGLATTTNVTTYTSAGVASASATSKYDANTSSYQVGVTYTLTPQIVLMAQIAKVNDKAATNFDRKLVGLGADYNFSKTARAYVRYDSLNYNTNVASSGSEIKRTAIGVSKSF